MKLINQKITAKLFVTFALISRTNLLSVSKINKETIQNYRSSLSAARNATSKSIGDIKKQHKQAVADIHKEAKKEHALVRESAQKETKSARSLNTYQLRIAKLREIRAKTSKLHQKIESDKKAKLANVASLRTDRLKEVHNNHIKQTSAIKRAYDQKTKLIKVKKETKKTT